MSTIVPLTEADQQVVSSLRTLLGNALGPLEGDDPEEGSRPDSFLFEPDRFGHTNQHFPALLNALVAALKSIKDSVVETPAKLDAWRSAVHPVVQPYIKEGPDTCQSYTQAGNNCGVRLSTDASVLSGTCSRHKNHDWVTGGCHGMGCVTKANCLHCGQGGEGTLHCIACDRKVHEACVTEWLQEVCPSKAGLFDADRDAVLCANCLWRRWPTAVFLWSLVKLQPPWRSPRFDCWFCRRAPTRWWGNQLFVLRLLRSSRCSTRLTGCWPTC